MAVVRYDLDRDNLPRLTPEEEAALAGISDAEITVAAESDPDNPPLTNAELDRIAAARGIKRLRTRLGLSQAAFAVRYGIPVATLRQWEMARRTPDRATLSYLRVIAALPERVAGALAAE